MPTLRQLKKSVDQARVQWDVDLPKALNDVEAFARTLSQALGAISREEAVRSLQQYARERFESLR